MNFTYLKSLFITVDIIVIERGKKSLVTLYKLLNKLVFNLQSKFIRTTEFSLKSEANKAYLHAHKIIRSYWLSGRAERENTWLEVMTYARSMRHEREPNNYFPIRPSHAVNKHFFIWTLSKFWKIRKNCCDLNVMR